MEMTGISDAITDSPETWTQNVGWGKGVYISTYGCQMNNNDSERMYSLLEMSNYVPVSRPEDASLIIINSCSVREKPVHKVHSEVGSYRKLKEKNPDLKIGVGGCVGQQEKDRILKDIPLLDFVFGPDNIDSLPSLVGQVVSTQKRQAYAKFTHSKPYQVETLVRNPGVSVFVNITKGCDNFCTFCIVPFTRGRLRSRPTKDIISDIHALVKRGVKEVTLLGQNVNSYMSVEEVDFPNLLKAIAEDTDIERIRYTTSHPKDFNQDLVDVMAKYRAKICDYIHLPFQSGNTRILERMNRGYTKEEYLAKIDMIKAGLPGVSLSTDIIVGFPGEEDHEFEDTMDVMTRVGYESIYAFKYSPRPFTKAEKYEEQVDEDVKSQRLTRLLSEHREQAFKMAEVYEGQILPILVENVGERNPDLVTGRSSQNKVTHFKGTKDLIGKTVNVRITKAFPQNLNGEMV